MRSGVLAKKDKACAVSGTATPEEAKGGGWAHLPVSHLHKSQDHELVHWKDYELA